MELTKIPVRLSVAQIRKLKMGGAVGLKPGNFADGDASPHSLAVMPGNLRKIANANRKNKGMRLQLKPGEDLMDMMSGGSILGDIKSAFKKVGSTIKSVEKKAVSGAKKTVGSVVKGATKLGDKVVDVAKSKQVKRVGRKIASQLIRRGIPVATSALGSALASTAATMSGNPELAPVAGKIGAKLGREGGMELSKYVSRKTGYGMIVPVMNGKSPRLVGPGGIRKMTGEGFLPAGDKSGSGIAVVAPSPPSDVIQIGSPYAKLNSAAMNPFIAPSIQLSGRKMGAGFMPAGGV
jgi:hypothetical protein